jgi:5-methyltetrahydropteroyltriglutamate--homocysteine methyltransferase
VPRGKMIVLGIMTSKKADLESKDTLKRRIDEAARHVPMEQLGISPQCGFSSTVQGNQITEDVQWRKLERLVEVAAETWR